MTALVDQLLSATSPPSVIPVEVWQDAEGDWHKRPLARWKQEASDTTTNRDVLERWWHRWPEARPGVPLAQAGWAVIDVDDPSDPAWVETWPPMRCVGPHSVDATPSGGTHYVFAQPNPPLAGRMRWSAGVEVLGSGCLLTVYDVEEILFPRVAPRAVLPEVFRKRYAGKEEGKDAGCPDRTPQDKEKPLREVGHEVGVVVAGVAAALAKMDAVDWRGDYPGWFALLTACQFVGVGREEFVRWSLRDPHYAADRREIERIFDSAKPKHGGALYKALSERGIKISAKRSPLYLRGPMGASGPTIDVRDRTRGLVAWLKREPTDDRLFRVAATFGEIILEKRIQRWVANDMLEGACQANGLWKLLGPDRCKRTIANGYRHVEEKVLGERE
jgi:Bifunctional DNA primase/polymerase, N-terminal